MSPTPSVIRSELDAYLRHGQAQGWSAATLANYRFHLGLLEPFLIGHGCWSLTEVSASDLDAFMAHLLGQGRARKSRLQAAILIRQLFAWLRERGTIAKNPARTLPLPNDGEEELLEPPLSEAEVRAIFDALPSVTNQGIRNRCLLELLYGSGLRVGEAVGVDADDLDLAERVVKVRNGKGGQHRLVPMTMSAVAAAKDYAVVRRHLLRGPDSGAWFLSHYGRRMSTGTIQNWFLRLSRSRGPDARALHAHLFRHSLAVHLLRSGTDVRYIQQLLGHSNLDTTRVYLRLVPGDLATSYHQAMPEIAVGLPHTTTT